MRRLSDRTGTGTVALWGILLEAFAVGLLFMATVPASGAVSPDAGSERSGTAAGYREGLPAGDSAANIPDPRIVGGVEVYPPDKYPFVAALVWRGGDAWADQFCGGSVISPDWVLTAAHCVFGESASEIDVVVGRHDLSTSAGDRIGVISIVVHPGYNETTSANDLALIHLASPTSFAPAALPANTSLEAPGTALTVAGWGDTMSDPKWPYKLREVEVPVVSDAVCSAAYAGFDDGPSAVDLCAGNLAAGGINSCQGDSGGPLFASTAGGFTQVGIVSRGNGCGLPGYPGIYTRVSAFTAWITDEAGLGPPPPPGSAKCFGVVATIVGTAAGETINGTAGADVIVGLGGNDIINGMGGADRICGGPGNDTISGGPGNDQVQGNAGNDTITGGLGADILKGGSGADRISGNAGNDRLFGDLGNDTLNGNAGTDTVTGGPGTDTCYGETKVSCEPSNSLDFESGTVHLAVSNTGDAISVISVDRPGVITDLNVGLLINHTWVGDLRVTLTHVDTGTAVTLIDRPGSPATSLGCSGNNINATLDDEASLLVEGQCLAATPTISGSLKPNNPLSAFDGENVGGTWRLTVTDWATLDDGFLEAWSLHFQA
jgi:subtilisin-like proprotein convertase family protein